MAIYRQMSLSEVKDDLLQPLNNAKQVNDDIGMAYTMMSQLGNAINILVPGMSYLVNALSNSLAWCANQAGAKIDENIETVEGIIQMMESHPSVHYVGVNFDTVQVVGDGGQSFDCVWDIEITGYWY